MIVMYKWSEMTWQEQEDLVKEKLMGWTRDKLLKSEALRFRESKFHPVVSIADAWEVLEKFEYHEVVKYPPGTRYIASVFYNGLWYQADALTAPEAICLAALKAVGVDVE